MGEKDNTYKQDCFYHVVSKWPEATLKLFLGNESVLDDFLVGGISPCKVWVMFVLKINFITSQS